MIISVEHRFVFLSMPKCASTAITGAIRRVRNVRATYPSEIKHTPYRDLERFILPYLESRVGLRRGDLTVMSLFREPIDQLHSWYRYRGRRELSRPAHPKHSRYTGNMSFDEFVEGYLSDPPLLAADLESQASFVTSASGDVGPDALIRYEAIDQVVTRLREVFGRRVRVKRRNVSPSVPYRLGEDLEGRLKEALARDYEIYESLA